MEVIELDIAAFLKFFLMSKEGLKPYGGAFRPKFLLFEIRQYIGRSSVCKGRQVLRVKGCFAGSKAENILTQGDMSGREIDLLVGTDVRRKRNHTCGQLVRVLPTGSSPSSACSRVLSDEGHGVL
nr:protease Do-like 7 [Tanacetum cinerariifolium]